MDFTYTSLITTVIFCNLMLVVIYLVLRKTAYLQKVGYSAIVLTLIAIAVRLIFPFEIRPISHNVYIPDVIAKYIIMINNPVGIVNLTIEQAIYIVWTVGAVVKVLLLANDCLSFQKRIKEDALDITNEPCVSAVLKKYKRHRLIGLKVYRTKLVTSPLLCGVFSQKILLPIDVIYDEQDVEYIICHEVTHYNSGDLYLKLMASLLNCIFWWNPCTLLIRNQLNEVLEIRVDDRVVNMTRNGVAYMTALLNAAKAELNVIRIPIMGFTSAKSEMTKRFEYMMSGKKRKNWRVPYLVVMVALYIFSYVIIFEPNYIDPKVLEEEGAIMLTRDNAFFVQNTDGAFILYYADKYFGTFQGIPEELTELEIR